MVPVLLGLFGCSERPPDPALRAVPSVGMSDRSMLIGGEPAWATRYTLCDFEDPRMPTANTGYPFASELTPDTGLSADPDVIAAVRSIQEVLLAEGFPGTEDRPLLVDGDYGPHTARAVARFQELFGLPITGRVGQATWYELAMTYCWKYH